MKISLIINADTRQGSEDDYSFVGKFENDILKGCRSWDFLTDGVQNKVNFFRGMDLETILYVDIHDPIPDYVQKKLEGMLYDGVITKMICLSEDRTVHRFNDWIYLKALRHATGDYVVHLDQDVCLFRRNESSIVKQYLDWLDNGYAYVCQPHIGGDQMHHASTRFFICKTSTLDLTEAGRLLEDSYRLSRFPGQHLPCLEHILGAMAAQPVLYPEPEFDDYMVFSWSHYKKGLLKELNSMTHQEVRDYIMISCGGMHGASDVIAA